MHTITLRLSSRETDRTTTQAWADGTIQVSLTGEIQPRYQAARRRSGVPHFLRDRGHREHFFLIEIREQKKLRERNVARRELFAQMQHETTLHVENDVGESLGVSTDLIGGRLCEHRFRTQSHLT